MSWENFIPLYQETYNRIQTQAEVYNNLYYIADAVDEINDHVWIDSNHLTPVGNQVVATTILNLLFDKADLR